MKICDFIRIGIVMALPLSIMSCSNDTRNYLGYGVYSERESKELGGQVGILYDDSLIAAHYYSRIEFPDSIKSIVFPYKMDDGYHFDSHGYAILNLKDKEYIYKEDAYFPIDTIIQIDRLNYALYNDCGRQFSTLKLTEISDDEYTVEFVPFFSKSAMPVLDFIRIGEAEIAKPNDGYLKEMLDYNPSAYRLFEHLLNMWGVECSPTNDLNFARAMRYFIAKEYNGNETKALAQVHSILEILGCGNTQDMTFCMSISRCLANMQLSWEYDRMIIYNPLYELEYVAWHNMIEAITHYMHFLYVNTDGYQCKQMDNEETLMNIFSERQKQLRNERQILNGNTNHIIVSDSLKTFASIDSLTEQYHSTKYNGYYHPMWHEIRPAIKEWLQSRDHISSSLPPDKAINFRMLNETIVDRLYYIVKEIDYWEMRPCLPN